MQDYKKLKVNNSDQGVTQDQFDSKPLARIFNPDTPYYCEDQQAFFPVIGTMDETRQEAIMRKKLNKYLKED